MQAKRSLHLLNLFVCLLAQVELEPLILGVPGVLSNVSLQTPPTVWQRPGSLTLPLLAVGAFSRIISQIMELICAFDIL